MVFQKKLINLLRNVLYITTFLLLVIDQFGQNKAIKTIYSLNMHYFISVNKTSSRIERLF